MNLRKKIAMVLLAFCCGCVFAASGFKKGAKLYVSVKSAELKETKSSVSKTTAKVSYGDVVIVVETDEKKTLVCLESNKNIQGWLANGSLTKKKIASSGSYNRASADELALAGKGFSEEAENAYRSSDSKLNFAEIDRIEKITVSKEEVESFKKEGGLTAKEEN